MRYLPNTEADRREMLAAIGLESVEELFSDIPEAVRFKGRLELPEAMSELELRRHMAELASGSSDLDRFACFLGAGAYDHFIPSVVGHILSRAEFYTAYTPYQAEISQGVLQSIYEYQTMICRLTGMDVANASMYDGATALAEAGLMTTGITRRKALVISSTVHPEYREVVKTYAGGADIEVREVPYTDGVTDLDALQKAVGQDTAGVLIQHPNFFGNLEPVSDIGGVAKEAGALFVPCVDPISLALLRAPADYGADIVVGEGQPLGNPVSFGGPYLGFFAARQKFMRRMPGRIVGATVDAEGKRGFVLTLQTREQHIRRERATSNICSNEALCALAATVYLSLMGPSGLRGVAEQCLKKSHYTLERLLEIPGVTREFSAPFFKEFVVRVEADPDTVNERLYERGIIGGLNLGRFYPELDGCMMFCVTEKRTGAEIEDLVEVIRGCVR